VAIFDRIARFRFAFTAGAAPNALDAGGTAGQEEFLKGWAMMTACKIVACKEIVLERWTFSHKTSRRPPKMNPIGLSALNLYAKVHFPHQPRLGIPSHAFRQCEAGGQC
jgi:hypothetical protein